MKKKTKAKIKPPSIYKIEALVDSLMERGARDRESINSLTSSVAAANSKQSASDQLLEELTERLKDIEEQNALKSRTINAILSDAKQMMEQLHTQFGFMSSFIIGRCFLQAPAPEHNPSHQNHHRYFRATGSHPKTFEITGSAFIKTGSGIEIVPSTTMREFFSRTVPIPISGEMFNQACSDMMNSVGKALPTALPSPGGN